MWVMNTDLLRRKKICLSGMLSAAGTVACCATVFGFLGRFSWFLDLFSHFRVQYFLGLAVIGAILFAAKSRKTASVFFAFACINLALIVPLYLGRQPPPHGGHRSLRAMLINVNTAAGSPDRVRRAILEADPDILVLEEISAGWVAGLTWLTNSHPYSCVRPREDNFGIGLFSKRPFAESKMEYIGHAGVPTVLATIDTAQGPLRVIATHPLPPAGPGYSWRRNDQIEQLADYARSSVPLILLGDLNVTPWNYYFRRLLKRGGIVDSAKGYGVQPTWPSHNPLLLIPLDHCLHSPDISIIHREIGPSVGSDHYPLIVDFLMEARPASATGVAEQSPSPQQ